MILDTCFIVDFSKEIPEAAELARKSDAIHLPLIALAEFRCGAAHPSANAKARADAEFFLSQLMRKSSVLGLTTETIVHYAEIWNELRKSGTPLPTNDIWIAALAREHRLPVATRDAHFGKIRGLKIVEW